MAREIVDAPYYAFYILDNRSNQYLLRSATHPFDDFEGIGPAYSGLALPKREQYLPPLSLEWEMMSDPISLISTGDVPLLVLQFAKNHALIRIGPMVKLSGKTRQKLQEFIDIIHSVVEELILNETKKIRDEITDISDHAVRQIASVATNKQAAIDVIIHTFSGLSGGIGGILIEHCNDEAKRQIFETTGLGDIKQHLERDPSSITLLNDLLEARAYKLITRSDQAFYSLPDYLLEKGVAALLLVQINPSGILFVMYGQEFDQDQFMSTGMFQIKMLAEQLAEIHSNQEEREYVSKVYASTLWNVSNLIDNLQPFTVGYSERMTRYSLVIGKELGMSDQDLLHLSLAAHLSNIGTLGLRHDILTKKGLYSDFEFEAMKMHSEIGASIIQIATGNPTVASYVLYHHERMDGNGYPEGLKGNEIPLGARILHVVQFFLAKIDGRSWRSALSFAKAMEAMKDASPKQLDPEVVNAFIAWWGKMGKKASLENRSIGRCFEMCSTPSHICATCAAFSSSTQNCWEVGSNQCKAHGKECSTCFVYTEYMSRQRHA